MRRSPENPLTCVTSGLEQTSTGFSMARHSSSDRLRSFSIWSRVFNNLSWSAANNQHISYPDLVKASSRWCCFAVLMCRWVNGTRCSLQIFLRISSSVKFLWPTTCSEIAQSASCPQSPRFSLSQCLYHRLQCPELSFESTVSGTDTAQIFVPYHNQSNSVRRNLILCNFARSR